MGELSTIKRLPCQSKCGWTGTETFGDHCPFLLHSLYPYFLGLLYKADMQDIWACCPAEYGIDTVMSRETNNKLFPDVPDDWWVIYAEVVKVNGYCQYGYMAGDKILFPVCHKENYICPAGINNIFPFLNLEIPKCINLNKLHCPDWKEDIFYKVNE